jgi:hypothetical protein
LSLFLKRTKGQISFSFFLLNGLKFFDNFFGICYYKKCNIDECDTIKKDFSDRIKLAALLKDLDESIADYTQHSLYFNIMYHLFYKKRFQNIYENHEDLYSLIQSYEGEDGKLVTSKELLNK